MNEKALRAKADERAREEFIEEQKQAILKMAGQACRRFVTEADDEWSVALYAFSRAIDTFEPQKGDFPGYADVLIRRDLASYYRRESRYAKEIEAAAGAAENRYAAPPSAADEIRQANEELARYGFRFLDLTDSSPRQERSRAECAKAVRCLLDDPRLLAQLKSSGKLPVRSVCGRSGVPEKTLDRYRKYIVMAAVLLSGDYPLLAERLKYIRGRTGR